MEPPNARHAHTDPGPAFRPAPWPAAGAWAIGFAALWLLDPQLDLANLALLLVLTSAVASLWLPAWAAVGAGALGVVAFDWTLVPPRHRFSVDLDQHVLLLASMLLVNVIVAALLTSQRRQARAARSHAEREERLRGWGDTLRDASDPPAYASALHDALVAAAGVPVAVIVLPDLAAKPEDEAAVLHSGECAAAQRAGLALCVRTGQAMGPGTGRHEEQPDRYLPLRGRGVTLGAAVLRGLGSARARDGALLAHAQALCDTMGLALQRSLAARDEQRSRELAREQGVRNALLAAISHDYRTPLATIMGAASALEEQAERLGLEQRRKLAAGIVEEVQRLSRLTDNTLQLARLDAPGVELRRDWESAEEIVASALRRVRRREEGTRVRARLEPGLPLLWCDAMLMSQLLDNLVDNALKYSPAEAPVEILVRRVGDTLLLAVRDRGPGIAPAWRERVFDVFRRGAGDETKAADAALVAQRPGAGVGLAVCRAIARAHGGELRLRARGHGGCSFECLLPLREAPAGPAAEKEAA